MRLELIFAAIIRVASSDPKSNPAAFKSTVITFFASAIVDDAAAKGVRITTVSPCSQSVVLTPDCQSVTSRYWFP